MILAQSLQVRLATGEAFFVPAVQQLVNQAVIRVHAEFSG